MTNETRILALVGSLRAGSYNRLLLQAARELAPPSLEFAEFDIGALPHFDADVEAAGDPEPVAELKQAIREADALLVFTPEYNRGIPGVLKNAIDWASRPPFGSPLTNKLVAIAGASTGMTGTRRAQDQLRETLTFPRARVLEEPRVLVGEAYAKFDDEGRLVDEPARAALAALLDALRADVAEPSAAVAGAARA